MKILKTMVLKTVVAAVAFAGVSFIDTDAQAVPISGAIEIGGQVTVESTTSLTEVDFMGDGSVIAASGDFAGLTGSLVTLTDIIFTSPGEIWSVGGFTFEAASFANIMANTAGGKDFTASGTLTAPGFDPTMGSFFFSSQTSGILASFSSSTITSPVPLPASALLLLTAMGGLGYLRARRRA